MLLYSHVYNIVIFARVYLFVSLTLYDISQKGITTDRKGAGGVFQKSCTVRVPPMACEVLCTPMAMKKNLKSLSNVYENHKNIGWHQLFLVFTKHINETSSVFVLISRHPRELQTFFNLYYRFEKITSFWSLLVATHPLRSWTTFAKSLNAFIRIKIGSTSKLSLKLVSFLKVQLIILI